jgi:SAM-dependent methyltransferase
MPLFDVSHIRHYYDRHTPTFLRRGQGGGAGSIHRAVWGPGTTTRLEAFHFVDGLIADWARSLLSGGATSLHLVDLGCGVGASLCYLAERLPMRGTGVTLSPVQRRLAAERVVNAGLSEKVTCIEGDYTAMPSSVGSADLAYAIESFVHGAWPERFFAECSRLVRPGGLLAICDDFVRPAGGPAAVRAVDRFRRGWRVNTLVRLDELVELATSAGFALESTTELSHCLELNRLRDRAIRIPAATVDRLCRALPSFLGHPLLARLEARYGPILGGSALQACLAHGWIEYDFVVFRRRENGHPAPVERTRQRTPALRVRRKVATTGI